MAPFRAKIGWKRLRKNENKNYRFVPFIPGAESKMPKKKVKKLEKLKRPRKIENKNYRFVPFLPDALQKIPKK